MQIDYQTLRFDYKRAADHDADDAHRLSGRRDRRGAGRACRSDRSGAAGRAHRARRQRRHALQRLARDLLCQAHARNLRPARLRRPDGREGRELERRQGVPAGRTDLHVQPAARNRPCASGVHQSSAVLRRRLSGRARAEHAKPADALEEQGHRPARSTTATSSCRSTRPMATIRCARNTWSPPTAHAVRCASRWASTATVARSRIAS